MQRALSFSLILLLAACQKGNGKSAPPPTPVTEDAAPVVASTDDAGAPPDPQIPPPFDVKVPPTDAITTPTGVTYKVMTEGTGKTPGKNDGVLVRYTAWRQDGTTFATTEPGTTPTPMMLYQTAGGFVDGLMLMKEGGKTMFWLPKDLAEPSNTKQLPEQLSFVIELVQVIPAPPTPPDLTKPPADAKKEKSGVIWKKVKTAKGDKARAWDQISFGYTGWDSDGRILESSEMAGKPLEIPVEGLPPVFADAVPHLAVGERARIWFPESMLGERPGKDPGNKLCFEVEVSAVTPLVKPPDAPTDVKAAPANALKTPKGVSYEVLTAAAAGGAHPKPTEKVLVNYTGWTTDGKRFDSSIPQGAPREIDMTEVIPGWVDTLVLMSPGDKWRLWVPEELAYKGQAQRPAGTLVFDLELVEIEQSKVQFTPPP